MEKILSRLLGPFGIAPRLLLAFARGGKFRLSCLQILNVLDGFRTALSRDLDVTVLGHASLFSQIPLPFGD
jgi:hypothetical protein